MQKSVHNNLSLTSGFKPKYNLYQITGLIAAIVSLIIMGISFIDNWPLSQTSGLILCILLFSVAVCLYSYGSYYKKPAGIKNNFVFQNRLSAKGSVGWILAIILTLFYTVLYFKASWLGGASIEGESNTGLIALFDPLSYLIRSKQADHWFMYGTLYTLAILTMGTKFIIKYRHNKYQLLRTISVMFFQLGFAYLIPDILGALNSELSYFSKDLKYIWPLNYDFFKEWHLKNLLAGGNLGMFFLIWGLLLIFVISPLLTYFYGKRWYCSWVCGCGGLAETAGDPFRQLSDKSLKAWKIERWMIHAVLVLVIIMTALVLYRFFSGNSHFLFIDTYLVSQWYGWLIGAVFSGVVGVGFYPIMGSRVWCRFGCPMAGILGLQQKFFSRFRITTNGSQCISCGNCSTYCEMGIDVKWYAQRGQDIVRASCVGCGICSAVCPRGVLRLENGPDIKMRAATQRALHIDHKGIKLIGNELDQP
jgi:polyferredoxin